MNESQLERIALCVDRLDNLDAANALPLPDELRVHALKSAIPEIRDEIKSALQELGFDPWS
jgi:hypothetical protein